MDSLKRNWWKMMAIVFVSLLVDMAFHLTIMPVTLPTDVAPSIFVQQDMVPPAAGIGLTITFLAYAVVFMLIQDHLPGKRLAKGLWYGACFTGLWFLGFIEGSVLFDTTFLDEFRNWLPDGFTLFLMSLALGAFLAQDSSAPMKKRSPGNKILSAFVVALSYLIGRYIAYGVAYINQAFNPIPLDVFLWTVAMAVWVGVMYGTLEAGAKGRSTVARAFYFSVVIFGIDWLLFNLFGLVFFALPVFNLAARALFDLAFIALGAFASERILVFRDSKG